MTKMGSEVSVFFRRASNVFEITFYFFTDQAGRKPPVIVAGPFQGPVKHFNEKDTSESK